MYCNVLKFGKSNDLLFIAIVAIDAVCLHIRKVHLNCYMILQYFVTFRGVFETENSHVFKNRHVKFLFEKLFSRM